MAIKILPLSFGRNEIIYRVKKGDLRELDFDTLGRLAHNVSSTTCVHLHTLPDGYFGVSIEGGVLPMKVFTPDEFRAFILENTQRTTH